MYLFLSQLCKASGLAAKAVTGFVPPPGDKTGCCILAYIIRFNLRDGEGNHQGGGLGGVMGMRKSCYSF